jgi:hypothetical protein
LNCFLYTGAWSFKWILCLKFVAKPRSYLLTLIHSELDYPGKKIWNSRWYHWRKTPH